MLASNKNNTLARTTRRSRRKSCVYINCDSSSTNNPDISYISFPKPCNPFRVYQRKGHNIDSCVHCAKAKRWMLLCGRTVDFYCLDHIDPRTTFVCEKHFINNQPSDEYPDPIEHNSEQALTGIWMDEPGPITVFFPKEVRHIPISKSRKRPKISLTDKVIKQENVEEAVEHERIVKAEEQIILNDIKIEPLPNDNSQYEMHLGIEPEITIKEEPINMNYGDAVEGNSNVKSEPYSNRSHFSTNEDMVQRDKEETKRKKDSSQYNYNQRLSIYSSNPETIAKSNKKKRDLEPTDDAPEQVYLQPINKEKYATLPKSIQKLLHELGPLKSTNAANKLISRSKRKDLTDVENSLNIEPTISLENCDSLPPIPCHLGQFDEMLSIQKENTDAEMNYGIYEEIHMSALMSYNICSNNSASFEFFTGLQLTTFDYIFNSYFKEEESAYKTAKNMFFMTLTFLRRGYSNDDMAHLFGIALENILRIVPYWINTLYTCFIKWRTFMFRRTAGVLVTLLDHNTAFKLAIDTFDITIKGEPTKFKCLFGIRANCQVAYMSNILMDSITFSKLFASSDIVKLLANDDLLVCNDDFNNALKKKYPNIKIVTPSSSKNIAAKKIMINEALEYAKDVSKLIKAFQILDNIPSQYKKHADRLVYICGCLVNFQWNRCWANSAEFSK